MSTLDGGRIGIAAQALGIARAFEHALSYSASASSSASPSYQHRLQAGGYTAALRPVPSPFAAELKEQHAPSMSPPWRRAYASDIALEVTNDALWIIHGGSGFSRAWQERPTATPRLPPSTRALTRSSGWSSLIWWAGKSPAARAVQGQEPAPITGIRKDHFRRMLLSRY